MLIHIFEETPYHYKPMQRFFSEQCSVDSPQEFWVRKTDNELANKDEHAHSDDIFKVYRSNKELFSFLSVLPNNAQIVFHGLNDINIIIRLLISPITKRCSCVIWGYELYRYNRTNRSIKEYLVQFIHSVTLKRFSQVITLNTGDGAVLNKYLKRHDFTVMPYPLIGVNKAAETQSDDRKTQPIKIFVGNSAAESNEHIAALKQLAHLANENIEVIVPLNYANNDKAYTTNIINIGRDIFFDKFKPITNMLTKGAYDDLLAEVDMVVFAHRRQQGLYVAYSMLLQGKALFLRENTTSYQNFISLGFTVYALSDLTQYDILPLQTLVKNSNENNKKLMNEHFTEKTLAPKWSSVLNALLAKSQL